MSQEVFKITKKELIEKLSKYEDNAKVTILTKDFNGDPYIGSVEKISWVETPDDEIEILLVPCD